MSRILKESYINSLPDPIADNMIALQKYVVERICKRLKSIGKLSASDAQAIKSAVEYAGADMRAIQKELSRIMGLNAKELDKLFEEVAAENVDFANTYYKARGMEELKDYTENAALKSLVEAAKRAAQDGVTNLSNTSMIGFKSGKRVVSLREYYIQIVDRAITFAQTGTVDYYTAMRSTVKEMARSGLRRVKFAPSAGFPEGYSRRLDSQVRMNLLDGIRQLNMQMMEQTGKEFGADGVEISAHALCAPDHQHIQGKQYSLEEFERLNRSLERPIGELNCHHFTTPIVLGVSKPVYSASELREINKRSNAKVSYDTVIQGKKTKKTVTRYEASQGQRTRETAIRYARDELEALEKFGDEMGARKARKRVSNMTAEYKRFCRDVGLTPRLERAR